MKTKSIFCADEQKFTEHELAVDNNGEIVATCPCGRFVKFAAGLTEAEVEGAIDAHETDNKLSPEAAAVEENRKASEEVVSDIAEGEVAPEVAPEEPV
jgi:hypothetical protein